MRNLHKIVLIALLLTLLVACGGQGKESTSSQPSQSTSVIPSTSETISGSSSATTSISSSSTQPGPAKSFEERLKDIVCVKKVEKVQIDELKNLFKEIYSVSFEQPVDWLDSSKGTFLQRLYVFYNGDNLVTEYRVQGYNLGKISSYTTSYVDELANRYKGNFIDIEYRMFGESHPSDFKIDGTKYYECQTSYHASKDFHNIISSLSTILSGKKIFSGVSKGGYTTEAMAYFYPNDIDAYVSYVAPLCDGLNDLRFIDFVYTSIGDLTYGATKAKQYRDLMMEFQKTLLSEKFRYKLQAEVMDYSVKEGYAKIQASEQELYEIAVVETTVFIWQYYQQFDRIQSALELPEEDETDVDMKVIALKSFFEESNVKKTMYVQDVYTPYYVQSYLEMGAPGYNLNYLRDAGANVKTDKSRDSSLMFDTFISKAQKDAFTYSNYMRNDLINFFNTTSKDIIKIVGLSDTWYAVKAPETTNSHIHTFEVKGSHLSTIDKLDEENKAACWTLIDNLLK